MHAHDERQQPPHWRVYLLLPLLHFASVKATFLCALSPENEVVVWLPNAVLLAALLHFRGQRGWLMALLTFGSDLVANLPVFPPLQALLLSLVNLAEVTLTYLLLRRAGVSANIARIQDLGTFVVAGPLLGALFSGLLAGGVLRTLDGVGTPYPTLVLLWWFGDALGLLIYTPLLLSLAQPLRGRLHVPWPDAVVALLSLGLAVAIFSGPGKVTGNVPLTPNLLLPCVLYLAVRFGPRGTSMAVAAIALAAAWAQTTGHKPFGDGSAHETILRTQEFILTLSIIGMGFATLLREQRLLTLGLEEKVRERTQALEQSNRKLAALSATDGLTGIANRRRFDEVLAGEWRRAGRSGLPLALAMLDVDWFKKFNDHYGHQAGDDCLRTIAGIMAAHMRRPGDLVARYGGEEFALITPATNAPRAIALARSICESLRGLKLPHASSPFGVVTVSIGVAVLVPGENEAALVKRADEALYQAKERGRDQVVLAELAGAS